MILGETTGSLACQAADVDQSGEIDATDIILSRSYCLGMIKEFPLPEIAEG